jgi:hypothetical protein
MKAFQWLLTGVFVVALCSCNTAPQGPLPTVDVRETHPSQEYVLQDVATIDYLALETTDDFLVNRGLIYADEKEIVMLERNVFYFFDRKTGKAKSRVYRQGNGGEEYAYASAPVYDGHELFVLATKADGKQILVYTPQGEFVRRLPVPKTVTEIVNYDVQSLVAYIDDKNVLQPYVWCSKADGKILDSLPLCVPQRMAAAFVDEGISVHFYLDLALPYAQGVMLAEIATDTLYAYTAKGGMKPLLVRTPSIQGMSLPIFLHSARDASRFLFFSTAVLEGRGDPRTMLVRTPEYVLDRHTQSIVTPVFLHNDYAPAKEIRFQGPGSRAVYGKDDLVQVLPADALYTAHEDGLLQGQLKEMASGLKEDDNPILMFVKFK